MGEARPAAASAGAVASVALRGLLDDRLVLVTGKGGTGKTTLAAALAGLLASQGRRTLLLEVDAQRPSLAPVFGVDEPGYAPLPVAPRLSVANVRWQEALTAFLTRVVGLGWAVKAILSSDLVQRFLDFTPGSQEVVFLSAICDHVEEFDVVVVDLPASGHAYSLLDITRSALGLFRAGPVRKRVEQLRARLTDARTRVVFVALPEEMVVNETVETRERFQAAGLLGAEPVVILNRAADIGPPASEAGARLDAAEAAMGEGGAAATPGRAALIAAGRWALERQAALVDARARLGAAAVELPPVVAGGDPARAVRGVQRALAAALGLQEIA